MKYIKLVSQKDRLIYWFPHYVERKLENVISKYTLLQYAFFVMDFDNNIIKSRLSAEDTFDLAMDALSDYSFLAMQEFRKPV